MITIVYHDNGCAGFHEPLPTKVSVQVILLLPLQDSFPWHPSQFQPTPLKKTSDLRQAKFCPICVRASQQLVPLFLILALSLNPVHEYSELI